MSKNFKADLSAVADEVPNHLDLDAGALTQRVARGQRRRKVTSGALTVLLVAGIGLGGYAVLNTLNHDSGPAAPLTSEPQILLDRPGVGDYSPACGAVWDPPSAPSSDVFAQNGLEVTLGAVELIESDLKTHLEKTLHATTSFDVSLAADAETSLQFGLERYVYLTKDSVVVARSGHGSAWAAVGLHLPGEKNHEHFGDITQFNVPLIDCATEEPLVFLESETAYYETGESLPAGTYQLHGRLPRANLVQGTRTIAEGDLWVGPALVTIPGPDQETTQDTTTVTAPLDRPGVGDYNPVCGATWDPAATIDDDVFVERGVRITLGNTGVIVPQPGRSPVKMTATSLTDIELTADQDLSIRFAEGSYAYLTKDSAVVAMGAQNRGALTPGTRLPYEQKHPEEPESLGAWLSLDLIDCRIIGGETIGLELPDEAFLPAGEYQLYGYVAADLFRGDELLGSGSLWAGPTQIDIPEQAEWPPSDS